MKIIINYLIEDDKNEKIKILAFVLLANDYYDLLDIFSINL